MSEIDMPDALIRLQTRVSNRSIGAFTAIENLAGVIGSDIRGARIVESNDPGGVEDEVLIQILTPGVLHAIYGKVDPLINGPAKYDARQTEYRYETRFLDDEWDVELAAKLEVRDPTVSRKHSLWSFATDFDVEVPHEQGERAQKVAAEFEEFAEALAREVFRLRRQSAVKP